MQSASAEDAFLDPPTAGAFAAWSDVADAGVASLSKLDRDGKRRGRVGDS